ncbi:hypothetical protein [Helicobacter fennelliae]|uniref:Uncharacterized protein n=1 Tax=Helicobacter fennelliae MRY12-0050 TaxID=1325130 RepID=T1DVY7_9HELI|nr:hypothetical protein [Helicobacter fennelliae]GAD19163.1 hypothetical protein HFN_0294 [Helicobacter fennelliae MRY12-0050]
MRSFYFHRILESKSRFYGLPRLPSGSLAMTILSGFFVRLTRSSNDKF